MADGRIAESDPAAAGMAHGVRKHPVRQSDRMPATEVSFPPTPRGERELFSIQNILVGCGMFQCDNLHFPRSSAAAVRL